LSSLVFAVDKLRHILQRLFGVVYRLLKGQI